MSEPGSDTTGNAGLGSWLLSSRRARGVSLEQAAEVTRISKSYIDALEREDFSKLPSPAYCKGFLRLYAGFLGVSPQEAVSRYEALIAEPVESVQPSPRGNALSQPARSQSAYQRWALPLILLGIVIFLSLFMDTDQRPPLNRPAPQPVVAPPVAPVAVQPVITSSRIAAPPATTPMQPDPNVQPAAAVPPVAGEAPAEGLILRLKVNQDSWLNVDIDGLVSKQYDLKGGDVIEWKAENSITLDIGNAGGVEGELNGRPLPSFGPAGKKAHTVLRTESTPPR